MNSTLMWIRYFSLPFVLKIEMKKKSVTLVKLSPMRDAGEIVTHACLFSGLCPQENTF